MSVRDKILFLLFTAILVFAGEKHSAEKKWAIGLSFRSASIPYGPSSSDKILSAIPMIFYEGKYVFFHGLSRGSNYYTFYLQWDFK